MSIRCFTTPQVRLNLPETCPPLMMDMDRFFEFSFWMAEELLELEGDFAAWQTPATGLYACDANGLPEDLQIDWESC